VPSEEKKKVWKSGECVCVRVSFKYLGSVMTSVNDIEIEIKSKIAVGNK
jgi:hypothetical protein